MAAPRSWTYGYDKTAYESSTQSQYKWVDPERTGPVPVDTRSAHFTLGDDTVSWQTASASTYGAPQGAERTKALKPTGGPAIVFGNDSVNYSSVSAASYSGPSSKRDEADEKRREEALKDRHTRHFVLGDDTPEFESEAMRQARYGVVAAEKKAPEYRKASEPLTAPKSGPSAIMFGTCAPEFTTTTSSSMVAHAVEARQRSIRPTQPAIHLGDDSVDYVTTRMAEEGLMSRKIGQRYIPACGASLEGVTAKIGAPRAEVDKPALSGVSWKLGSEEWKPETSASAAFSWPATDKAAAGSTGRVVIRSNIQLGDDGSSFVTEAGGSFKQPDLAAGGRQASSRPLAGGAITFGSDSVHYSSMSASTYSGKMPDATALEGRTLAKQRGSQRSIQFGDDSVDYESAAQAGAKGYISASGETGRPERVKGTSSASFVLGNSAAEWATTTGAANAHIGSAQYGPRSAMASAGPSIVFGDDRVEYVTNRMSEEGSQTKTLNQRYQPRGTSAK